MSFFYGFCMIVAVGYVGFRKRRPDLFTLAIASCAYYSSTLASGVIYDPDSHQYLKIHDHIYWFYAFLLMLMFLGVVLNDRFFVQRTTKIVRAKFLLEFNLLLLSTIFLIIFIQSPRAFFPSEVGGFSAASYGAIYSVYWVSAITYGIFSVKTKSFGHLALAVLFLASTLLAGSRAYLTTGFLAMLLVFFSMKEGFVIFGSVRRILFLIFGFAFLIIFKNVYQYILLLDFALIADAAANWELVLFRLTRGGESIVLLNFQRAIEFSEFGFGSFVDLVLLRIIPFVSDLYIAVLQIRPDTLSDLLNERYYTTVNYGMASSMWGLAYYVAGPLGTLLAAIWFVSAIFILNRLLFSGGILAPHLLAGSTLLAFYVHRQEIGAVLFPFYMGLFIYFVFRITQAALSEALSARKIVDE
tara:strand:+ start:3593 stop:4831 length:1239 start_codon:yes stop_codon:yes gene_type:complete